MSKSVLFSVIYIFFFHSLIAQKITPFNSKSTYECITVKGKILPWMGIAAGQTGINSLIGLEFGFKKRHSLGIDLYSNRWKWTEDRYDSVKQDYVAIYSARYRDHAVFLNYRFYFNNTKLREKYGKSLYEGIFTRLGKWHQYYDKGYVTDIISNDEIHYSAGLLFGILFSSAPKKLGGDINLGFYCKYKEMTEVIVENQENVNHNSFNTGFGIRMGLNFYLWGYRNKNKTSD